MVDFRFVEFNIIWVFRRNKVVLMPCLCFRCIDLHISCDAAVTRKKCNRISVAIRELSISNSFVSCWGIDLGLKRIRVSVSRKCCNYVDVRFTVGSSKRNVNLYIVWRWIKMTTTLCLTRGDEVLTGHLGLNF